MKPTMYILCGAPGCGKSTFAQNFATDNTIWVSRDSVRFSIVASEEDYFSHEKEVFAKFIERIAGLLENHYDVIADATHLNMASRKKLTNAVDNYIKDYNIVYIIFTASADMCIAHNANRTGRANVPEDAIRRMRATLTIPNREDAREIGLITIEGELRK